ncbi:MAG: modification methylase, HemK family, partial [Frankiales bacterium]|nr:modification methylase, HemK family [Frankiales bacterium]
RAAGCVFAEEEAGLLLEAGGGELIDRRVAGEPLEHLLGWVAFAGLRVAVGPGVFVPRRRTELMARVAIDRTPAVFVELCCGAAAVTAAVEAALPDAQTWATDIDPVAVSWAARNTRGATATGDLDEALPGSLEGQVDVLACNAPYVPSDEVRHLPSEARDHEPRTALDGGADGLDVIRRAATCAARWLRPGGALLVEVSEHQADAARRALDAAGLQPETVRDEMCTVLVGVSTGDFSDTPRDVRHS